LQVQSDLSIAPREGRDFFGERNEDCLLFPIEIRIDEAVKVAWERWKKMDRHSEEQTWLTAVAKLCGGK
jgi:hypothetical protein